MTDWTAAIERERPRLFAIAYRMLGSASDAEDVLQDAWMRARSTDEPARSPSALLATIVTRLCLDRLKSARHARESYVGTWLPEPIAAAPSSEPRPSDDRVDEAESLSMAVLVVLETLSPLERAVFVLREVFDYGFDEIAEVLGRSEAACRQLFHRAREHVAARRPRFTAAPEDTMRLVSTMMTALAQGDVAAIERTLAEDVVVRQDGAGLRGTARRDIVGRDKVARFIAGVSKRAAPGARLEPTWANGAPAVVLWLDRRLVGAVLFEADDRGVRQIQIVSAPSKLRYLEAQLGAR